MPERHFVLFASLARPAGRCPACDGVMDETGCRIGDYFFLKPHARARTGIAQIIEVFCEATPTARAVECPACQ